MENIKVLDKMTPHETCWVPVVWAIRLLTSAHEDDKNMRRLESPVFANLLSAIDKIEANNRKLLNYGWVNFPLAYTQVWNYYDFTKPFPNYINTILCYCLIVKLLNFLFRSLHLLFLRTFLQHYLEGNFYYRIIPTMMPIS